MRDPGEFDAFYEESRGRLLLQAYALTGDLPAARSAVRNAFVAAWHHWRKVSLLADLESWVRPHAWRQAQRRHQTRLWHRERTLDEGSRATLESLRKLSVQRRKTLLLTQLSSVSLAQMAREVGLTDARAAEELEAATTHLCDALGIGATSIRPRLEELAEHLGEIDFPQAASIRRAGANRRRAHTAVGVLLCTTALLVSGTIVHTSDGQAPLLGGREINKPERTRVARLVPGDLLAREQLDAVLKPRTVTGSLRTDDNTADDGRYSVCQAEPFAAPDGLGALVRRFSLSGNPKADSVQSAELAHDVTSAHAAYLRMLNWYAGCEEPRVQLVAAHRLDGIGDEAMLLTMRSWEAPVTTHQAAVARTGTMITLSLVNTRGKDGPDTDAMLTLIGDAVTRLCASAPAEDSGGDCVIGAEAVRVPPPPTRQASGMLQVLDLPPMPDAELPWVGVKPRKPTTNAAATRCDNASFLGKKISRARTRTFVIPGADLPSEFGITETLGRFRSPKAAKKFVQRIRTQMSGCEEKDLTTEVVETSHHEQSGEQLTIWRVTTEVSETKTVLYRMGIMRRGAVVAQVGFTPGGDQGLAEGGFTALAMRALRRLEYLPD